MENCPPCSPFSKNKSTFSSRRSMIKHGKAPSELFSVQTIDAPERYKSNVSHQKDIAIPRGPKIREYSIKQILSAFYKNFAQKTTAHGFKWTITDQPCSVKGKISILLVGIALVCVSIAVVKSTSEYLLQTSYQTRFDVESDGHRESFMPDFIICHSSPWSIEKARNLNISMDLLSYITVSLNPYNAMIEILPERYAIYSKLEAQFQKLLHGSFNGNLRSLLDAVTIDCSDFIRICMMGTFGSWRECCQNVFNLTGIYSFDGKCFTTKGVMSHRFYIASSFDALQIVISMDRKEPYELLNGAIATWSSYALRGISFAIIDENDDPIVALYNSDFISYGLMTRTKLKKTIIDRGGINCFNNIGTNYSQRNCKMNNMIREIQSEISCIPIGLLLTTSETAGVKYCSPIESLKIVNETKTMQGKFQAIPEGDKENCKSECFITTYESSISAQTLKNDYYRKVVAKKPSKVLLLHTLYFPSFNHGRITHVPRGIVDWLGDVGGNCGFYLGASIFSIFEILYFLFKVVVVFFLYVFGCSVVKTTDIQQTPDEEISNS